MMVAPPRTPISRSLLCYCVLAYAISWGVFIPLALQKHGVADFGIPFPVYYLAPFGPFLAAVIAAGAVERRSALKDLFRRFLLWRMPARWWLIAFSPLIALLLLLPLARIFAGVRIDPASFGQVEFLPDLGLLALPLWLFTYGVGEETGWRGFLLPRLQRNRSALLATLILFLCWAGWHIPAFWLVYDPAIAPGFLVGLLAGAIFFTWLFNGSGGSLLIVTVWHGAFNFATAAKASKAGFVSAVLSTLVMIWAVVVLIKYGKKLMSGKNAAICFFILASGMMPAERAVSQWTSTTNPSLVYIGSPEISSGWGSAFDAMVDKDKCLFLVIEYAEKLHLVKINPDGYRMFETDLSDNPGSAFELSWQYGGGCRLVSDGDGGAIVAWMDHRNSERDTISGDFTNNAIRAQRILKDGTAGWNSSDGIIVADESSGRKMWYGLSPAVNILSDFHGGAYIDWLRDSRSAMEIARYQHVRSDGTLQFDISGKELYDGSVLQGHSIGDIVDVDSTSMAMRVFVRQPYALNPNNLYLVRDSNGVVQDVHQLDADDILEWRGGTIWKSRITTVDTSTTLVTYSLLKKYPDVIWDTTYSVHGTCYGRSDVAESIQDYTFFDPCARRFHIMKPPGMSFNIPIPHLTTYRRLLPSSGTYYCFNDDITECVRLDEKSWWYWPQSLKILDMTPSNNYRLLSDRQSGAFLIFNIDKFYRIQHINPDGTLGMRSTEVKSGNAMGMPVGKKCSVYPLPAGDNSLVSLEIESESSKSLVFHLYDILGRMRKEAIYQVRKGRNAFSLDMGGVAAGVYSFILLEQDGSMYAKGTIVK